ncbi:MAG TPA: hypothetical protein VMH77_06745, partial [Steroidobacteraceae bacterium]|nr:hypothetical protein [Steroidobacteraceae bacterium]
MVRDITRLPVMAAALLAAGCATVAVQSPPEVVPQPPPVTAGEAVTNARIAARQDGQRQSQDNRAHHARVGPTSRSTREIRDQNAEVQPPLDLEQRLDSAHDRLYAWEQGVVEGTDRMFAAKDRPLEPVPAAPFRIATTLDAFARAPHLDTDVDFDIALHLPNIQKRLGVFVTSEELDEDTRAVNRNSRLRAGLRYELVRALDFDLGVRLDVPPVAFASVKWSREHDLGAWQFYPLLKLFAETNDGLGAAGGATFDHWSGRQLLRSSSYGKWLRDSGQTEWSQTFIYAQARELIVPERYG